MKGIDDVLLSSERISFTLKPAMPGISKSDIIRSGINSLASFIPRIPSLAERTLKLFSLNNSTIIFLSLESSSMINSFFQEILSAEK
jgi:hypothetical protein